MKLPIFKTLKNPKYLFACIGSAILVFDFNYYLMSTLPGSRDEMCVMGINLNPGNIIFSVVLSVLIAVLITGLIALFVKKAAQRKVELASLSGVGLGLGLFTFFCPICAIPLLSTAGFSVVFQAFNDFNLVFKIVSVGTLLVTLFLLNRHLGDECVQCVVRPKGK
jgi:hypothetical protein